MPRHEQRSSDKSSSWRETVRVLVVGCGPWHLAMRAGAWGFVLATALLVRRWDLDAGTYILVVLGAGAISVTALAGFHAIASTHAVATPPSSV